MDLSPERSPAAAAGSPMQTSPAAQQPAAARAAPPAAPAGMHDSMQDLSQQMIFYYRRCFPYAEMVKWLGYGDTEYMRRREWSFTSGEIYMRYLSFGTEDELRTALTKRHPDKIDIGGVYSVCPRDRASVRPEAFFPQERELVFDIDLTDYDDVRTCCSGATICHRCWAYMNVAVKVLNRALREDFGFQHITFVYSGRRGIHAWVCDPAARALTNEQRNAVVSFLSLPRGNERSGARMDLTYPLHPSLQEAYALLEPVFEGNIITAEGQGLLATPDQWARVLELVPDDALRAAVAEQWARTQGRLTPAQRWQQLKASVEQQVETMAKRRRTAGGAPAAGGGAAGDAAAGGNLRTCIAEIVFTFCYPRLDEHVSTNRNHLLKSPFCVHPKTGRVCIPIDVDAVDSFNPEDVPTVAQLEAEVNAGAEVTSLDAIVSTFRTGFLRKLGTVRGEAAAEREMSW